MHTSRPILTIDLRKNRTMKKEEMNSPIDRRGAKVQNNDGLKFAQEFRKTECKQLEA